MKATKSLTAAITAVALVAGAGYAYAQSATSPTTDSAGPVVQQSPSAPATGDTSSSSTLQAQPSTSTGTSVDNSSTVQPEPMAPRADRN